jgi:hypothetical protein
MGDTTINDTVRNDPTSREPSGSAGRSWVAAALLALCSTISCGAPSEAIDDSEQSGSRSDAFVATGPNSTEFKTLSPTIQPPNGVGDPGFCTPNGAHSKIMFSRDTTGYVQGQADVVGIQGVWGKYGGSASLRKFDSRPVCAFLPGTTSPYSFIILARGVTASDGTSDKRLFWSRGQWTVSETAPPPASVTQWAAVSSTSFNTNGRPAVASRGNTLVAIYFDDNGQLKGNYWTGSGFSSTVSAASLPAGFSGVGSPTIAYFDPWSKFVIFLRARNSANEYRYYMTSFTTTSFSSGGGAYFEFLPPDGAPAVQSDFAYEYDNYSAAGYATLYYRSGTRLYQGSSIDNYFNVTTFRVVTNGSATAPNVSGNPLAIGGVPYEAGRHWLLIRGTGGILWGETFNDENLAVN